MARRQDTRQGRRLTFTMKLTLTAGPRCAPDFKTCLEDRHPERLTPNIDSLLELNRDSETFTAYNENVRDLCKRGDPFMHDLEKLRHIAKKIRDDAFEMIALKIPT